MSHAEPPDHEPPDVDGLLRAFVEQPVPPMPPAEAAALRDRITSRLGAQRARSPGGRGQRVRARPWLVFAVAACLPLGIWLAASQLHNGAERRAGTARITRIAGQAEIAGDELRTGPDVLARASLPTGAVVEVGPSARMRFEATGRDAATRDRIELAAGRIEVRVPKLASGDEVRVQTEEATVVVHGTKFSVERLAGAGAGHAQGETRVVVTEGVVAVETSRGERTLTAGMELVVPEPLADPGLPAAARAAAAAESDPAPATSSATSTLAAENALLAEAMRLRRGRQSDRALALLDGMLARYPGSPLTETARVERLRALEETGSTDRLAREAERYLTDYPRGFARAEAERMLATTRAHSP